MRFMRELRTIDQVLLALGDGDRSLGRAELRRITGKPQQNITNWCAFGFLPKWTYIILSHALEPQGFTIKPALCGLPAPRVRKAS